MSNSIFRIVRKFVFFFCQDGRQWLLNTGFLIWEETNPNSTETEENGVGHWNFIFLNKISWACVCLCVWVNVRLYSQYKEVSIKFFFRATPFFWSSVHIFQEIYCELANRFHRCKEPGHGNFFEIARMWIDHTHTHSRSHIHTSKYSWMQKQRNAIDCSALREFECVELFKVQCLCVG